MQNIVIQPHLFLQKLAQLLAGFNLISKYQHFAVLRMQMNVFQNPHQLHLLVLYNNNLLLNVFISLVLLADLDDCWICQIVIHQ